MRRSAIYSVKKAVCLSLEQEAVEALVAIRFTLQQTVLTSISRSQLTRYAYAQAFGEALDSISIDDLFAERQGKEVSTQKRRPKG